MLSFAVGPVMINEKIREQAAEQIPYFRTPEFSDTMLDNERLLKKFFKASDDCRVVFMTGSGTASMEASVMSCLTSNDKAIVVNGGSFGQRFCQLLSIHKIPYSEIKCEYGRTLKKEQLLGYSKKGYTALLVNLDETSTGVLYDIQMISDFCKENDIFLIVDSISSFLCDDFNMEELGVNCVITGSQKALALAPGLSVICLDDKAIHRIKTNPVQSLYFDLNLYLSNGERGQTPFTPAVGILLQLNTRLHMIDDEGGVDFEVSKTKKLATYFRDRIKDLPFEMFADKKSNAVTSLTLKNKSLSAYSVFSIMKDNYHIFVCPNGGDLKEKVFRVGHIGDLKVEDYDVLLTAFSDMAKKGLIN
jgi:aspartate aminotransferase-like enzyme